MTTPARRSHKAMCRRCQVREVCSMKAHPKTSTNDSCNPPGSTWCRSHRREPSREQPPHSRPGIVPADLFPRAHGARPIVVGPFSDTQPAPAHRGGQLGAQLRVLRWWVLGPQESGAKCLVTQGFVAQTMATEQ